MHKRKDLQRKKKKFSKIQIKMNPASYLSGGTLRSDRGSGQAFMFRGIVPQMVDDGDKHEKYRRHRGQT